METDSPHTRHTLTRQEPAKVSLDKRLAILFWPLLIILAGIIGLFPAEAIREGTWLIGIGLILLALNVVRALNKIPVRVLPTILGALALATGLAEYGGARLPLVPLTLIVLGASILFEVWPVRR